MRVAKPFTRLLLQPEQAASQFGLQLDGQLGMFKIKPAHVGGDCEPRRHRDGEQCHLRQSSALAAEQAAHGAIAFDDAVAESIDVLSEVIHGLDLKWT